MGKMTKRPINFRFDQYRQLEQKLEKMAERGLFLKGIGIYLWSFEKDTPHPRRYTVTYFSEASTFNPGATENQQTYYDYAEQAGWQLAAEHGKMQVFFTDDPAAVPFETDEQEKLDNIKKCTGRSFVPSALLVMVVFLANLATQYSSYLRAPADFLASNTALLAVLSAVLVILYFGGMLASYLWWCRRSQASIKLGGGCIEVNPLLQKIVDIFFLTCIFGLLVLLMVNVADTIQLPILLLQLLQVPVLAVVFGSCIKLLKRRKVAAGINMVVSVGLLLLAAAVCTSFIGYLTIRFSAVENRRSYQVVNWQLSPTESHEYRLYSDELPLTCADLYGASDYLYYSREKEVDSTVFLTRSSYRQDSLPAKDAPPRIEYTVLEPKQDWVYNVVAADLRQPPQWSTKQLLPLDNSIFGTVEAYQTYYDTTPTGGYLLLYPDKLVELELDQPATPAQVATIRQKLALD